MKKIILALALAVITGCSENRALSGKISIDVYFLESLEIKHYNDTAFIKAFVKDERVKDVKEDERIILYITTDDVKALESIREELHQIETNASYSAIVKGFDVKYCSNIDEAIEKLRHENGSWFVARYRL